MEKKVIINSGRVQIDGLFEQNSLEEAAIITHPHPLYGGNMDNSVVAILQTQLINNGYSTLRFNFRQVTIKGTDQDSTNDLNAAILFLQDKGFQTPVLLAGYSYGSWINTLAVSNGLRVSDSIMISPPVAFLDYKTIKTLPVPGLVVTGSNDDIAPAALVEKSIEMWNPKLKFKVIKGCDHFYGGYTDKLGETVSGYLQNSSP